MSDIFEHFRRIPRPSKPVERCEPERSLLVRAVQVAFPSLLESLESQHGANTILHGLVTYMTDVLDPQDLAHALGYVDASLHSDSFALLVKGIPEGEYLTKLGIAYRLGQTHWKTSHPLESSA